MNKLYALILLLLGQSICAMQSSEPAQPKPRVFSFFNGGKSFEENVSDDEVINSLRTFGYLSGNEVEQLKQKLKPLEYLSNEQKLNKSFEFCLAVWKEKNFCTGAFSDSFQGWQDTLKNQGWTDEAINESWVRRTKIVCSAKQYDISITCTKIAAAHVGSYAIIDHLLKTFSQRFFVQNDKGIVTVRDISVPVTSLLVATGIR